MSDKSPQSLWVAAIGLSASGFTLAVAIVVGYYIGNYLDNRWDCRPVMMIICLFIGMIAGFLNLFRMVKRFCK